MGQVPSNTAAAPAPAPPGGTAPQATDSAALRDVVRTAVVNPEAGPFGRAVRNESAALVARIVAECDVDLNAPDEFGDPPLHAAVARCRRDVAEVLVSSGADLGVVDFLGRTAAHRAALAGDATQMQWLLAQGASPHAATLDGFTVLHAAICGGDAATVDTLLRARPTLNTAVLPELETPVHAAAAVPLPTQLDRLLRGLVRTRDGEAVADPTFDPRTGLCEADAVWAEVPDDADDGVSVGTAAYPAARGAASTRATTEDGDGGAHSWRCGQCGRWECATPRRCLSAAPALGGQLHANPFVAQPDAHGQLPLGYAAEALRTGRLPARTNAEMLLYFTANRALEMLPA